MTRSNQCLSAERLVRRVVVVYCLLLGWAAKLCPVDLHSESAMPTDLPRLFLARHGDTPWTDSGQHTGRTDLPLNERGERNARQLGERLQQNVFARVFSSPLQRAFKTCELAGYAKRAEIDSDLLEWDYGVFEGKTTAEILKGHPDWQLYRDGCPKGESPDDVAGRADRFIVRIRAMDG